MPDAILIPHDFEPGGKAPDRRSRVFDYCEATLGGKVYVNTGRYFPAEDGAHFVFVHREPHDTLDHPTGHPAEKTPRYDWEGQPNGCRFGTLKPDAWRAENGGRQKPVSVYTEPGTRNDADEAPRDPGDLQRWHKLAMNPKRTEAEQQEFQALDAVLFRNPPEATKATHAPRE